jgi:hypothetical protein
MFSNEIGSEKVKRTRCSGRLCYSYTGTTKFLITGNI